jgi:hypothetical protein
MHFIEMARFQIFLGNSPLRAYLAAQAARVTNPIVDTHLHKLTRSRWSRKFNVSSTGFWFSGVVQ